MPSNTSNTSEKQDTPPDFYLTEDGKVIVMAHLREAIGEALSSDDVITAAACLKLLQMVKQAPVV